MSEETKYVTWDVHNEFAKRIEEQEHRQDARLSDLEKKQGEITEIVASVRELAVEMKNMTAEQKRTSERLDEIEKKPAKRWDAIVTGIIGAVVGAIGEAIMSGIIH